MKTEKSGLVLGYGGIMPKIAEDVFIAPTASVMGDVEIGRGSSIWFGVVVRGDVNFIRIGTNTNLQDGTVVHVTRNTHPTLIGNDVTIGHRAALHGCTLEDGAFIGMQATVMDGAVVEGGAMVAAGALVPPRKRVLRGEIWAGVPAKWLRDVNQQERDFMAVSPGNYAALAAAYKKDGIG